MIADNIFHDLNDTLKLSDNSYDDCYRHLHGTNGVQWDTTSNVRFD